MASGAPQSPPRVSLGVPVYEAERFLEETMDSLLAQTLSDFELIISDNASSDRTEEICRRYADADPRVRYVRHEQNQGASWNHTFLALEAKAPYFKWAAADDVCEPTYLERCVEVLDNDPSAVLCQPKTIEIDEQGAVIGPYDHRLRVSSDQMVERWEDLLNIGYACYHVYGVIRTEALLETGLMGVFIESDMVLLAELALRGRFAEIDERLFRHRIHPGQSTMVHENLYDRGAWFDASKQWKPSFPTWRFAWEYFRAVQRADLTPAQRRACYRVEAQWAMHIKRRFLRDFKHAGRITRRNLKRKLAQP
jgi:glycosyltransferase involved in cell wall biosynthesis